MPVFRPDGPETFSQATLHSCDDLTQITIHTLRSHATTSIRPAVRAPVPLVLPACHCCPSLLRVPAPHACSPKAQLPWTIGNVGRLEGFVDPVYRPIVGSAPPCITTLRTYELAGNSDPTHSTPWVAPSRLLLILHRQRGDPVWARSSLRLLHHVIIKVQ